MRPPPTPGRARHVSASSFTACDQTVMKARIQPPHTIPSWILPPSFSKCPCRDKPDTTLQSQYQTYTKAPSPTETNPPFSKSHLTRRRANTTCTTPRCQLRQYWTTSMEVPTPFRRRQCTRDQGQSHPQKHSPSTRTNSRISQTCWAGSDSMKLERVCFGLETACGQDTMD